ncbi:MAG: hypothetical protein HKN62_09400 [Phycisphaerales bacterium]|nr:hypothetical protein [Phycisphaerales bacterium]
MLRAIGAAVVGYIVALVLVFVGLTVLWIVLGPDGAFEPGGWDTSLTWNLVNPVIGLAAAIVAGWVCALISPGGRSIAILVGLIVVLGALSAVSVMMKPEPTTPRVETVTMFEAMNAAQAPLWTVILNPIVGVIGVVIGGRLRGRPAAASAS